MGGLCHCERSEAIQGPGMINLVGCPGLLRHARNDGGRCRHGSLVRSAGIVLPIPEILPIPNNIKHRGQLRHISEIPIEFSGKMTRQNVIKNTRQIDLMPWDCRPRDSDTRWNAGEGSRPPTYFVGWRNTRQSCQSLRNYKMKCQQARTDEVVTIGHDPTPIHASL